MFHAVTTHLGIDLQETGGGGGRLCRHTCLTIGFELHKVKNIRTHNNRLQTKDRATISFEEFVDEIVDLYSFIGGSHCMVLSLVSVRP